MDIYINIVPSRCSLWTSNNITNTCRTGGNSLNRTPWAHPRNCQVLQIHHLIELHSSPGRVWTCYLVPETGTNKDKHDSKVCENMRKSCFTLPAKKTYPLPRPFWRWVSFSQVGICSFCGGGNCIMQHQPLACGSLSWRAKWGTRQLPAMGASVCCWL